jgi:hypothetical protein
MERPDETKPAPAQGGVSGDARLERLIGALVVAVQAQTAAFETFAEAAGTLADQITSLQGTLGQRSTELRTKRDEMIAAAKERGERARAAIREIRRGTPPVSS